MRLAGCGPRLDVVVQRAQDAVLGLPRRVHRAAPILASRRAHRRSDWALEAPPGHRRAIASSARPNAPSQSRSFVSSRTDGLEDLELVPVSASRLEQLLEAEITSLALRTAQPLTLSNILELAKSAHDEGELGELLHEELPVRFAQRIKMLEALPDWHSREAIANVRDMYVTSFKELRLADPRQPGQFRRQIRNIKERHAQTNLLVGGFKQYAEVDRMPEEEINEWLDRFFALRISTNMLMANYLQMSDGGVGSVGSSLEMRNLDFDPEYNPYRGSIDANCNPSRIARHAAHVVSRMCRVRYGVAPSIVVKDTEAQALPFVPRYLFYIVSELLKNSVRATVEAHGGGVTLEDRGAHGGSSVREEDMPPVTVVVSGDELTCCCRIADEGGGIPIDNLSHVWSYMYTTAEPIECPVSRLAVDAPADLRRLAQQEEALARDTNEDVQHILFRSPLAGLGCGLPLSRLYATYLGGSIHLQTLPNFGTDVFIYLNRLGSSESLPQI